MSLRFAIISSALVAIRNVFIMFLAKSDSRLGSIYGSGIRSPEPLAGLFGFTVIPPPAPPGGGPGGGDWDVANAANVASERCR